VLVAIMRKQTVMNAVAKVTLCLALSVGAALMELTCQLSLKL
jgi:hypothetical protein